MRAGLQINLQTKTSVLAKLISLKSCGSRLSVPIFVLHLASLHLPDDSATAKVFPGKHLWMIFASKTASSERAFYKL
jgi:hypothetical protein